MKTLKLSVVLATHNEAANLGRCLKAIIGLADEIVIIDGRSTDDTVKIAKKFEARVTLTDNLPNFHIMKNMAIDAAKGEWVLQLDADEIVSPELAREIQSTINDERSTMNGYWLNRKNWFLDRFLTKGGQYPDPTLRLYRRGFGRLPARDVHEQAVVKGPTGYLKSELLHYRDTSFAKYLDGFNLYTSFIAGQMQTQKLKFNILNVLLYLCLKPLSTFIKIYFRHRGYVDGYPGFVFALFSGLVHAVSYIKYWQITKYPENSSFPLFDKEGDQRGSS